MCANRCLKIDSSVDTKNVYLVDDVKSNDVKHVLDKRDGSYLLWKCLPTFTIINILRIYYKTSSAGMPKMFSNNTYI